MFWFVLICLESLHCQKAKSTNLDCFLETFRIFLWGVRNQTYSSKAKRLEIQNPDLWFVLNFKNPHCTTCQIRISIFKTWWISNPTEIRICLTGSKSGSEQESHDLKSGSNLLSHANNLGDLGGDLGDIYIWEIFGGGGGWVTYKGCTGGCTGECLVHLKTHFKKIMLTLSLICHVFSVGM
jgi:hypothetical protein